MKKGQLLEAPDVATKRVVVLCGDITLHRRFFSDSASKATGITLVRCDENVEKTFPLLLQSNASLLVARQTFIEQLPGDSVLQIGKFGKGIHVLAILESEMPEAESSSNLLRLGCRGVLPHRFSSKILRRAVLAILRGEIWAPRFLVSELVSDLLRAASLKSERGLTPQETRILELSSQGLTNSAIADALFISLGTVRWHKRRLNRKLRAELKGHPHAKVPPPSRKAAAS